MHSRMILIVEDDPVARRALVSLLQARGIQSKGVESAEDALAALEKESEPGMVLIDIDLPGMSGLDLVRTLQMHHPNLSCTLMSANPHDVSAKEDRREVPFLSKPLDLHRLLNVLGVSA